MTKEDIQFKIASLERNKIIMAVEMVGVNTAVALGIFLVDRYMGAAQFKELLIILGGLFGIGYSLFASVGNLKRYTQIKELEKKLDIEVTN